VSTALQAVALVVVLVLSATAGPRVLRHAAPALTRMPRLAIALVMASLVAWVLGLLALGPMLAWILTGPDVLPSASAEVCQRCLLAANPSAAPLLETGLPVVALLVAPAVAAALLLASAVAEARRRGRASRESALRLRTLAVRRHLHGHSVLVTDDRRPFALTLPRRLGGIVVSSGVLDLLTDEELRAVLAHEDAHLRQHHHLVTAVVESLARRLRWIPLYAAASDALGHYVEIAADDAARRRTGAPALASALLTLGQNSRPGPGMAPAGALHVLGGPDRVRHLVQPGSGLAGVTYAVVTTCALSTLAFLGFAVHVPYAVAVLNGCA
jgi:hypothetical protein